MFMALSLCLLEGAQAQTYITSISDEIEISLTGGWARVFPADEGWHFLWAAGGDFVLLPMTEDYEVDDRGRTNLTGDTDMIDHAITTCPDGTYLHAASADAAGEYAKAFRYDENFTMLSEAVIAEKNQGRRHNDMPLICGGKGNWTSLAIDYGISDFLRLDDDLNVVEDTELTGIPPTEGATLLRDPWSGEMLLINSPHHSNAIAFVLLDEELNMLDEWSVGVAPSDEDAYWAQAAMIIGQHVVVAYMSRKQSDGFADDWGDVWVSVFDENWNAVETQQVSYNTPPGGGMRPGFARKGEVLVLSYDRFDPDSNKVIPGVFELKLDLDALGVGSDTGFHDPLPDSGEPDSGEEGAGGVGGCGGCSAGEGSSGAAWWIAPLLLGLGRRFSGGSVHFPQ